jgi:sterol desaturase/sphingolipid hydroxylase (fatty acid hydroxylase superfamily)
MPWVDKLFGTLHLPAKQWPTSYGVDTPVAPGMIGQLLDPLAPAGNTRRRVRDEREALLS